MKKILFLFFLFCLSFQSSFAEEEDSWKHLFGVHYSYNTVATFEGGVVNDGSSTAFFDSEIKFKNGLGIMYEARKSAPNAWGKAFGLEYMLEREIDEYEQNGEKASLSGDRAKIQITTVFASAVYQWDNFYLPFGLNFSRVNYYPPSNFKGSVDSEGGVGLHFGLGWSFEGNSYLELISKAFPYSLETKNGSNTVDFGAGTLGYAGFNFKYNFF